MDTQGPTAPANAQSPVRRSPVCLSIRLARSVYQNQASIDAAPPTLITLSNKRCLRSG